MQNFIANSAWFFRRFILQLPFPRKYVVSASIDIHNAGICKKGTFQIVQRLNLPRCQINGTIYPPAMWLPSFTRSRTVSNLFLPNPDPPRLGKTSFAPEESKLKYIGRALSVVKWKGRYMQHGNNNEKKEYKLVELAPHLLMFLGCSNMEWKINVQKQLWFCNDNNEEKDEETRHSKLCKTLVDPILSLSLQR